MFRFGLRVMYSFIYILFFIIIIIWNSGQLLNLVPMNSCACITAAVRNGSPAGRKLGAQSKFPHTYSIYLLSLLQELECLEQYYK